MATDSQNMEQAVSRTLRDSLEKIQRTAEELHQAISDLVAACASSRPTNALPPMIRAQSAAASLSASLEVLSRFVTAAMQSGMRSPFEQEAIRVTSLVGPESPAAPARPAPNLPTPMSNLPQAAHPSSSEPPVFRRDSEPASEPASVLEPSVPARPEAPFAPPPPPADSSLDLAMNLLQETAGATPAGALPPPAAEPSFNIQNLPTDQQELHRRAYRVAKVSMQDIQMLRPDDVQLGRKNKDLCVRLRDDIEKAHKEYDRRFQPILTHPVDYFYDWMVEILAGGDPAALGEYPYPSPAFRR